jgi:hypothetical protein
MTIGQTSPARDASVTAIAIVAPLSAPAAPAPVPSDEPAESFGPATRVEIGETSKPAPSPYMAAATENVINIDDQTRTVVFQSRNSATGAVIFQIPDESKLKLRAYLEEVAQQTAAVTAGTHPDPSKIDRIRI